MKKIIVFLVIMTGALGVQAQYGGGGLPGKSVHDDEQHMGFSTSYVADTVDESDTFYLFNPRPASGLWFNHLSNAYHQECNGLLPGDTAYVFDTMITPDWMEVCYNPHAHKILNDSSITLYGIAATMYPSIWRVTEREGPLPCFEQFEYPNHMPLLKEMTRFRYELLQKVPGATDSIMEIIDTLWLDTSNMFKKVWFKYKIDSLGESRFKNWYHWYYPQEEELVVPCYEIYFDNPFDSIHQLNGDFYLGRTVDTTANTVPYYEETGVKEYFYMTQFAPYYLDTSDSPLHFFRYADDGTIQSYVTTNGYLINGYDEVRHPWGLLFPITGLRCKQIHNLHIEETGERYILFAWEGGEDDEVSTFEIRILDNSTDSATIVTGSTIVDTSYMFPGLDPTTKYTFQVRKRCRYATSHYDTLVWSNWNSLSFILQEPDTSIVDTTTVDTTHVDTTHVDTTIIDTTGITMVEGDADFSMHPNPAFDNVEIRLQYPVAETAELTIYDMRGRRVRSIHLSKGTKRLTINLTGLTDGAYLIKVLTPRGLTTRRLLIK